MHVRFNKSDNMLLQCMPHARMYCGSDYQSLYTYSTGSLNANQKSIRQHTCQNGLSGYLYMHKQDEVFMHTFTGWGYYKGNDIGILANEGEIQF